MKDDIKIIRFTGWHGTDERNVDEILENNFRESSPDDEWFGGVVYFFMEGIGNPVEHAQNWAKSDAYSKKYSRFVVLEADTAVNDDAVLDLRVKEGLELFDKHRRYVLRQIRLNRRAFRVRKESYCDGKVIEHMKQVANLEVIVANMYVQFLQDRIEKIYSRIPNCTFLCVSNPNENINQDTIKVVAQGNI